MTNDCNVINELIEYELEDLARYETKIQSVKDPYLLQRLYDIMGKKCEIVVSLRKYHMISGCSEPSEKYKDRLKIIDNNDSYWE